MSRYALLGDGRRALPVDQIAEHLDVQPATIRDWVRRGLLRRSAGSVGRPLYDLRAAYQASKAPKPRRDTTRRERAVVASVSNRDHSSARTTMPRTH